MAGVDIEAYVKLVPIVKRSPRQCLRSSYDAEADTLYVSFKQPSHATDSELTDDDVILRYEGDEIIGFTILRASTR